jgi:hypothetical protein
MWRMSRRTPDGKVPCVANGMRTGWGSALTTATGAICTTGDAQQAHVQRTQNAGQPLSGVDSLVPTPQFSGTTSELRPLASANNRARSAMRSARRIRCHLTPRQSRAAPPLGPARSNGSGALTRSSASPERALISATRE